MKVFWMYRRGDLSATHASEAVNPPGDPQFEGIVFDDGRCILHWLTEIRSVSVWDSFEDAMAIHGHPEYDSELVWHEVDAADPELVSLLTQPQEHTYE